MADTELSHAPLEALDKFSGHTFLHQKSRTGAAHLALIEPDGIDNAFNRAVKIGVIENDKGRLATEFQRQRLSGSRRHLADETAHFGGPREGNLVYACMFNKGSTRRPLASHHIENARRQACLVCQFRKQQGRQRGKLRRLQHHRISGSQSWGHFPSQHQQWKIPRNDLANHADCSVGG